MFKIFYVLGLKSYWLLIFIASFFNQKAKFWIDGRKKNREKIENSGVQESENIWIHVSSLGEFEQARPLIEQIKLYYPQYKIVLTFFSPSGYEIRKNYTLADYVWYLPVDSNFNSKWFIKAVNPKFAFFVKYDFWYYYLRNLFENNIPTYLISGIFRHGQVFFKSWGKGYTMVLKYFTHLFVQNTQSKELLCKIGINNVTVAGDTRFDRVINIAENSADFPIIESFLTNKFCIVAGSTWLPDELLLAQYVEQTPDIQLIIAPHEINEEHISRLLELFNCKTNRYTKSEGKDLSTYKVLIIDTMGMLSSIYKYGQIAYIGGGFGAGIHNIVEPAVFGLPIVFGPKYKKFKEAVDLVELKAAFVVKKAEELNLTFDKFRNSHKFLSETSDIAKNYVYSNKGTTKIIIDFVFRKIV